MNKNEMKSDMTEYIQIWMNEFRYEWVNSNMNKWIQIRMNEFKFEGMNLDMNRENLRELKKSEWNYQSEPIRIKIIRMNGVF